MSFQQSNKYSLTHSKKWQEITPGLEFSETTYQADNRERPRRVVMVRQEIEKRPNAAGKMVRQLKLFDEVNDLSFPYEAEFF